MTNIEFERLSTQSKSSPAGYIAFIVVSLLASLGLLGLGAQNEGYINAVLYNLDVLFHIVR